MAKPRKPKLDVSALFEEALRARGLKFERDDAGVYSFEANGMPMTASLENVRRNAERDGDPEAIARFVDKLLETPRRTTPPWSEASRFLFFAAEPSDQDFGDTIRSPVTDTFVRVLTLTDAETSFVRWVNPALCSHWQVTEDDAIAAARLNQDRLLEGLTLEVAEVKGEKLGMVPLDSPYKASVIFAARFKELVTPELGWPVLAVIPCRDFIYVVRDNSPLLGGMGSVVLQEFNDSGYPITTEVLRVSDDGIEAIGAFRRGG